MMKTMFLSAGIALATVMATPLWAADPVCKLTSGEAVPELEALNELVLGARFDDFAAAISATMTLPADGLAAIKAAFPKPFARCTTLALREDVGGLIQEIVMFEQADGGVFYAYWTGGYWNEGFDLRYLNVNTDYSVISALLR